MRIRLGWFVCCVFGVVIGEALTSARTFAQAHPHTQTHYLSLSYPAMVTGLQVVWQEIFLLCWIKTMELAVIRSSNHSAIQTFSSYSFSFLSFVLSEAAFVVIIYHRRQLNVFRVFLCLITQFQVHQHTCTQT